MTDTYPVPGLSALGWIRPGDGAWLYVHAGGALGASGPAPVPADVPAVLGCYRLPDPPADAAGLRAAAGHSLGLVGDLPARIGAPLAGLAYRAAVSRVPAPVVIAGPPGSYKTSMARVVLHHFAPGVTGDAPPPQRGSTEAAAARLMHLTRDSLLLADDAAAERAAAIIWAQYNAEARLRLGPGGGLRDPEVPRGSLLVTTGERALPQSASQRVLIVPAAPGLIDGAALALRQEHGPRHGRALVMSSFICWQAARREQVLARAGELAAGYAQAWAGAGLGERTAEALGHLAAGWRLMLDHLTDKRAYTEQECEVIWAAAWAGLDEAGRMQVPVTAGGVR